jgi:predicted metalloprotease
MPRATALLAAAGLAVLVTAAGCGGTDKTAKTPAKATPVVPAVSQVPRVGNAAGATQTPHGTGALARLPPAPRAHGPAPRIAGVEGVPIAQALDTVGNDVGQFWLGQFNAAKLRFEPAKQAILTATTTGVTTLCGQNPPAAVSATTSGPFYCGADRTVFLEIPFFEKRIVPVGDAATATVVAHEWGHHIENMLGLFNDPRFQSGPRMELTADCLAGVWMSSVYQRKALDPTDVKEALTALAQAGDNPSAPPTARPHGSAAQRQAAFNVGYNDGRAGDCKNVQA